jgi:hypothetical protein
MFVVRDRFQCKPGKSKDVASRFKQLLTLMQRDTNFSNGRVMLDVVSSYWTVIIEIECESLAEFEKRQAEFGQNPEAQTIMAGYMDLVEGGGREIFRLA